MGISMPSYRHPPLSNGVTAMTHLFEVHLHNGDTLYATLSNRSLEHFGRHASAAYALDIETSSIATMKLLTTFDH